MPQILRYRTVISSHSSGLLPNLREIWRYRDLLATLIWRDFITRYRQSLLGISWAVFRPLLSVAVFTVFSGMMGVRGVDGTPYPLFSLTGMIPWLFFSGTVMAATSSIANAGGLLTKVYFPRMILPISSVVGGGSDLIIQLVLLMGLMMWYGTGVTAFLILAPLFLLQCVILSFACGIWMTALNVRYRDVGQALPFLMQMVFFLTPVLYPGSKVPSDWQLWFRLNPMVGILDGFRWSVYGASPPATAEIVLSVSMTLLLFVTAVGYFRRVEDYFADIL